MAASLKEDAILPGTENLSSTTEHAACLFAQEVSQNSHPRLPGGLKIQPNVYFQLLVGTSWVTGTAGLGIMLPFRHCAELYQILSVYYQHGRPLILPLWPGVSQSLLPWSYAANTMKHHEGYTCKKFKSQCLST
jgi:hypothetical protein